eukprot:scaffold15190_cov80-Skeletonema_marinoi.AAC.1
MTPAVITKTSEKSRISEATFPSTILLFCIIPVVVLKLNNSSAPTEIKHPAACINVPIQTVLILSHSSASFPSHGETIVRNNAHVNPSDAGAASDPGLHSNRRSGVANSHVLDPSRLSVVDSKMSNA